MGGELYSELKCWHVHFLPVVVTAIVTTALKAYPKDVSTGLSPSGVISVSNRTSGISKHSANHISEHAASIRPLTCPHPRHDDGFTRGCNRSIPSHLSPPDKPSRSTIIRPSLSDGTTSQSHASEYHPPFAILLLILLFLRTPSAVHAPPHATRRPIKPTNRCRALPCAFSILRRRR